MLQGTTSFLSLSPLASSLSLSLSLSFFYRDEFPPPYRCHTHDPDAKGIPNNPFLSSFPRNAERSHLPSATYLQSYPGETADIFFQLIPFLFSLFSFSLSFENVRINPDTDSSITLPCDGQRWITVQIFFTREGAKRDVDEEKEEEEEEEGRVEAE